MKMPYSFLPFDRQLSRNVGTLVQGILLGKRLFCNGGSLLASVVLETNRQGFTAAMQSTYLEVAKRLLIRKEVLIKHMFFLSLGIVPGARNRGLHGFGLQCFCNASDYDCDY